MSLSYGPGYDRFPIYVAGVEATKEYYSKEKIKKVNPKIKLLVTPFLPPLAPVELVSQDMGGLIISCEYAKSRSAPGGAYNISLAADDARMTKSMSGVTPFNTLWNLMGKSMEDIFRPMAYSQLWVDGYHVMSVYLSTIRKTTSANGNKIYNLQFSELGNIYQQNIAGTKTIMVGIDQHIIQDTQKLLHFASKQIASPLSLAVWEAVNAFIMSSLSYGTKGFPMPWWSTSEGIPMAMRLIAQPPPFGGISTTSLLTTITTDTTLFKMAAGQSFWEYLKTLAPAPFMEIFTESGGRTICTGRSLVGSAITSVAALAQVAGGGIPKPLPSINTAVLLPGFNYLIMRTSPYDNPLIGISLWGTVLTPFILGIMDLILAGDFVIITDDDVIEKDLGRSEAQQSTIFGYSGSGKAASGEPSTMTNRPSIAGGPLLPFMSGGVRTFGSREFHAGISSTSLAWSGILGQSIEKYVKKTFEAPAMSTLLNYWFRNASKFKEGSITTRAMPYARPGMALLYLPSLTGTKVDELRDIGVYYIDNVQYSYSLGSAPRMIYSVIRGTPLPLSVANALTLLMDWEIFPVGFNLVDGDPT